jgi:tetratricopeptide (TPR) repeat protein
MLHLARGTQDPDLLLEAYNGLGAAVFYLGELVQSREHFKQANEIYDQKRHSPHAFIYGLDPGVFCLSYDARLLGYLGYPEQARAKMVQALNLAQTIEHPITLASALHCAAEVHRQRGEAQASLECAERELELSGEQGFPLWFALAQIYRGWALARLGHHGEALATIPKGIADYRATGAEMAVPIFLGLLAEAYHQAGKTDEGLHVLEEAITIVQRVDDRSSGAADLYRLRGDLLLLAGSRHHEAEASLRRALEIARGQQAKSLELRATMSLARLLDSQGKRPEARDTLAAVYTWFTEGVETSDLKAAKALIEELSA